MIFGMVKAVSRTGCFLCVVYMIRFEGALLPAFFLGVFSVLGWADE